MIQKVEQRKMGRRTRVFPIGALMFVLGTSGLSFYGLGQAQSSTDKSVWEGVYTKDQAARGRFNYQANCMPCHGEDLSGTNARPLVGENFMRGWSGIKLDLLFERAQQMPPGAELSLDDGTYLDIVTYVLESNQFPAGTEELTPEVLRTIIIQGKDGPEPVGNFSLARVVGCLTRGPDNSWVVTKAGEPVRTRDPDPSKADELKDAEEALLGSGTFNMMFVYPSPEAYEGHKIEVKGFLIRGPKDSINVSTWQSLAATCEQAQ